MKIPDKALALLVVGVLTSAVSDALDDEQYPYWHEFLSSPFEVCAYRGFMQVDYVGQQKCLYRNEAICKDGWELGIFRTDTGTSNEYYLQLRKESRPPVYFDYKGATELCIGEKWGNQAYLTVKVPNGVHYLIGPDIGHPHKLPRLKIRPQKGGCRGTFDGKERMLKGCDDDEVIVRYRDGAGDDNCLWEILFSGDTRTCPGAIWAFFPNPEPQPQLPSFMPSGSPSSTPSTSPSSAPSSIPSITPSVIPSSEPSSIPSSQPSGTPSLAPSNIPTGTNGGQAIVNIACTATNTGSGSVMDCDMIPACNPMAGTSCEWTFTWNYNVINDSDQDATLMVLNTTLCHGQCTGGYVLDGGCMEGSSPTCGEEITVKPEGDMIIPSGQNRRFSIENWETVDLSMGGMKVYGYVVAMLEPEDGNMLVDHDQSCVYKCDEALAAHGLDRGRGGDEAAMTASFEDEDSDGLRTPVEIALGTDPIVSDTDGDGASDGEEVVAGTNPLDPEDKPQPVGTDDANGVGSIKESDTSVGGEFYEESYTSESRRLTAPPVSLTPSVSPVTDSPKTVKPTASPSASPVTDGPTSYVDADFATASPTDVPTKLPTTAPSKAPVSFSPTDFPSDPPTSHPSSRPQTESPTALPPKMPISVLPTAIPTINPRTPSPTATPSELVDAVAADETCQVSVDIGCSVYHNKELIDCSIFRRSNQDNIEIRWDYAVTNQCSYAITARRAMVMKCHKCPTLVTSNGPNSCNSDTTLFRDASGGQAIIIGAGKTLSIVETDAVELSRICDSPLVTSFSRFVAMRVSAVEIEIEQGSTQITAAQSMGPVCRASYDVWPGMHECQSNRVSEHTSKGDQNV